MSLFEDNRYQYRDTFFIFFEGQHRPDIEKIEACLAELGPRYKTVQRKEQDGAFEALTFVSPYDFCLLYTSPSPRDQRGSRMPSSA